MKKFNFLFALSLFIKSIFFSENVKADENPIIFMLLETGSVKIETYPNYAPNTVKRILELSNNALLPSCPSEPPPNDNNRFFQFVGAKS